MALVFDDEDIRRVLTPRDAVRWIADAVDAAHGGRLVAPPRLHADLGDGRLVFTTGRYGDEWFGYRSYDTFPTESGSQVVVVHDGRSGEVRAVAIGNELGPRRVGAIGAVAVDALTSPEAGVVAVIGAGTQAWYQLWALPAVRTIREVRVFARDPRRREQFARQGEALTGAPCRPTPDAPTAVDGAQIIILATNSATPVIEAAWLPRSAYVATLGPKQQGRAEFALELPESASVLVTDSLDQIRAYDPPNVLVGSPHERRLQSLGAVRARGIRPATGGRTVFFSVGLAGTEAFLLDRLARLA